MAPLSNNALAYSSCFFSSSCSFYDSLKKAGESHRTTQRTTKMKKREEKKKALKGVDKYCSVKSKNYNPNKCQKYCKKSNSGSAYCKPFIKAKKK